MEFKPQLVLPGFAESCSKMYILPTLTYLEVGVPAGASKIFIFEHFKWEPIADGVAIATVEGAIPDDVLGGAEGVDDERRLRFLRCVAEQ